MAERAYLRQDVPMPDRGLPVDGATLRAVRGRVADVAMRARMSIAVAKLWDEEMDASLEATPEYVESAPGLS